ncbi:AI-2E family transporter [Lapillicoccus sp.]|uniref:AI-2E family transporter n=1 Tax=Lapillicoccus sp. TaxID=1909287 RepID=UPI0025E1C271|nr:AI-2E family transporter [Lapillicoccus sp.]
MTETPPETSPVPAPVRAASEWAWRLLIIAVAVVAAAYALGHLSEVVIPVIIATLLTALLSGIHLWLTKHMPRGLAAGVTLLGTILVIAGLLTLAGTQISGGMGDMAAQAASGITQIRDWLRTTFNITDSQFDGYVDQLTTALQSSTDLRSYAAKAGVTATHVVAGLFISLFGLFFFLYDGPGIWGWIVQLFPRRARSRVESSGHVAWRQLTAYTHATVLVAATDAVGITVGALILRVPFALAIGVLVFVLSFIPIVGALLSGSVAVLLALVAHGPVNALIMLGVVVVVQQVESHVLQPFVLGRSVRIHPLAVILSIAAGAVLAGIVGTLIAVPTAAVVSSVWRHLVSGDADALTAASEDDGPTPEDESAAVPA